MATKVYGESEITKVRPQSIEEENLSIPLQNKIKGINLSESKTASGTYVDFDIPEGVKRVTVMFLGLSTSGTAYIQTKIGSNSIIEESGYTEVACRLQDSTAVSIGSLSSSGFTYRYSAATNVLHGVTYLNYMGDSIWIFNGFATNTYTYQMCNITGTKSTSDLNVLRITTSNGTDTFDGGSINISWEF